MVSFWIKDQEKLLHPNGDTKKIVFTDNFHTEAQQLSPFNVVKYGTPYSYHYTRKLGRPSYRGNWCYYNWGQEIFCYNKAGPRKFFNGTF